MVLERIKPEVPSNCKGRNQLGRPNKGMGIGVAVGALAKVPIEGMHDGVFLLLVGAFTGPLANAGSACVGKDFAANLFKDLEQSVSFGRETHLLRAWSNAVLRRYFEILCLGLPSNGRRSGHVFVRRIGAGTDESYLDVHGPTVLFCEGTHLRNGGG